MSTALTISASLAQIGEFSFILAGLARATHLFVAVTSPFEAARIIEQARAANPKAEIIARACTDADVDLLKSMGASHALIGEDEIARGMLARAPKKKPAAAAGVH